MSETLVDFNRRMSRPWSPDKANNKTHPAWIMLLCLLLAAAYYQAVCEVYHPSDYSPWAATLALGLFVVSGICFVATTGLEGVLPDCLRSEMLVSRLHKGSGLSKMVFLFSMLVQFQIYMAMVAWQYPWACDFFTVSEDPGHVRTYRESNGRLEIVDKASLDSVGGFDWDIECNDNLSVLGTRGGREIISILSHVVPFLFAGVYVVVVSSRLRLNFTGMVMNYIDVQDFFLLLLDENMILGYWNKADVYRRTSATLGGYYIWRLVFIWFILASVHICVFPLIKILSAPVPPDPVTTAVAHTVEGTIIGVLVPEAQVPETCADVVIEDIEAPPAVPDTASRRDGPGRCCGYQVLAINRLEAATSLAILDGPFFVLRVYCSMKLRILASSLLIKNLFSMVYNIVRLIGKEEIFSDRHKCLRRCCCGLQPLLHLVERLAVFFLQGSDAGSDGTSKA